MKPRMLPPPPTAPPDWRRHLRSLAPTKAATLTQARHTTTRQADQLRTWLADTGSLTARTLARLPGLTLRRTPLGSTGPRLSSHSSYQHGGWLIHTDSALPTWMTRWAIAHEIKHILDASLRAEQTELLTPQQREALCDHFAACLLKPTSRDLMQLRNEGRPRYPAAGMTDMITTSGPEVSKDDLAPTGDSG